MNRQLWIIGLFVALSAGTAHAEDTLQLGGFATASYSGNFDRRAAEFKLDQAELDVSRDLSPQGSIRVDLEWVADGQDWVAAVEQGWLAYKPAFTTSLTLTGGRFNAPIGFESLDQPDMFQITHGLLFTYCTPSNLTGAMAGLGLGHGLDAKVYAANDWDLNSENNASPTFGGRLGWAGNEKVAGGVSVITGMRDPGQRLRESVLDVDLTVTPTARLVLGAEFNGCQADLSGQDASWAGFMVMAHWKAHERLGLTGRYDLVDDSDDLLFGSGLEERRSSATLATIVTLGPGMRFFGELRMDMSDHDVFTDHDGEATSSTLGGAVNLTYVF